MSKIRVEYDGEYPNRCRGTLRIWVDGEQIYKEKFRCYSTGRAYLDSEQIPRVNYGRLVWEDAEDYDDDIREAVKEKLAGYTVCCGGCI